MQYMLLIHSDDSGFFAMKPAEQQQAMGAYMAFTEALRKAGEHLRQRGTEVRQAGTD